MHVVFGQPHSSVIAQRLADALGKLGLNGTLYLGYPVLASAEEPISVDALLLTRETGLVVFVFDRAQRLPTSDDDWAALKDDQDEVVFALQSSLSRHRELRSGRDLAVKISAITVLPAPAVPPAAFDGVSVVVPDAPETAFPAIKPPIEDKHWEAVNAAIQKVTTIKPRKKRAEVTRTDSRGALLKKIEAEIANLDRWQQQAAIESPNGPQRIRGLAGSGKTVVLALKAAYLHAQHPDWRIAVTFYSRSLYQQLKDLIRRFSFEHLGDEPDWEKIQLLHAWGGRGRAGMYHTMADHANAIARDWAYAKSAFGSNRAFEGICRELEAVVEEEPPEPLFDAVLVDEAQDLPRSFFRLVYAFTKEPKRVVWAYDELQNLSDAAMPTTEEMFGTKSDGSPKVVLDAENGGPRRDIVLPVCYRNTPWALTLAHALGFGIYRCGGLVQHFDDPALWQDIGYQVVDGSLMPGEDVSLRRKQDSYPSYFEELLEPSDAIQTKVLSDHEEQTQWVAKRIEENLRHDELQYDDVLVVLANPLTARKQAPGLMRALARHGIDSHLVGETTSSDEIFWPSSIAITHIYRAKGNEAPMVYVLDSQSCVQGHELIKLRNMLFTSITRSRAWLRLCGYGTAMETLAEEIRAVLQNEYQLRFRVPTPPELLRLRRVHRDLSDAERRKRADAERGLEKFLRALEAGELDLANLPSDIRERLRALSNRAASDAE